MGDSRSIDLGAFGTSSLRPLMTDGQGNVYFHNPAADISGQAQPIIKPMSSLPPDQQAAIQAANLPTSYHNAPVIQAQPDEPMQAQPVVTRHGTQMPLAPPRAPPPRDMGTIAPIQVRLPADPQIAKQLALAAALRGRVKR